jgi:hypothetical protein
MKITFNQVDFRLGPKGFQRPGGIRRIGDLGECLVFSRSNARFWKGIPEAPMTAVGRLPLRVRCIQSRMSVNWKLQYDYESGGNPTNVHGLLHAVLSEANGLGKSDE